MHNPTHYVIVAGQCPCGGWFNVLKSHNDVRSVHTPILYCGETCARKFKRRRRGNHMVCGGCRRHFPLREYVPAFVDLPGRESLVVPELCVKCLRLLETTCKGKRRYRSYRSAKFHRNRWRETDPTITGELRAYVCPLSAHWHLGRPVTGFGADDIMDRMLRSASVIVNSLSVAELVLLLAAWDEYAGGAAFASET